MPSYKLTYFKGKGIAEPIRYLLSYGNHQFEDIRLEFNETWPAKSLAYPCKKIPILEFDGKTYSQSLAICRYLAEPLGLCGNTKEENLLIDLTVDTICDFRNACSSYFWDELPASKESKKPGLISDTIPTYMNYLENQAKKNNGYLALDRLTWADIHLTASSDYISHMCGLNIYEGKPTLKALVDKVNNLPAIKKYLLTRPETPF